MLREEEVVPIAAQWAGLACMAVEVASDHLAEGAAFGLHQQGGLASGPPRGLEEGIGRHQVAALVLGPQRVVGFDLLRLAGDLVVHRHLVPTFRVPPSQQGSQSVPRLPLRLLRITLHRRSCPPRFVATTRTRPATESHQTASKADYAAH